MKTTWKTFGPKKKQIGQGMENKMSNTMIITLRGGLVESVSVAEKTDMDVYVNDKDVEDNEVLFPHLNLYKKIIPVITDGVPITDVDKLIASGLADLEAGLIWKHPDKKEAIKIHIEKFRMGMGK
jgi:hypothetical protein